MNILLVGLGKIGAEYDKDLNTSFTHRNSLLRNKEKINLYYFDVSFKKSEYFSKLDDAILVKSFEDIEEIIDLTIISVPTKFHLRIFKNIIYKVNTLNILIEKPVGLNYEESQTIYEIAKTNQKNVFVNYMRNSLPSTSEIISYIELIDNSNINISISFTGSFTNNGSHFVSLVAKIFDINLDDFHRVFSNKNISVFKNNRLTMNLQSLNYPFSFFNLHILHNNGLIIYDETNKKWEIYETSPSSLKNINGEILKHVKDINLELETAQDYLLENVLNFSNRPNEYIQLPHAVSIHRLFESSSN